MLTKTEETVRWSWPRYNAPGLLIGPLPMLRSPCGAWAPDWSSPGVTERFCVEHEFYDHLERPR
jgi:hypothetical protein